MTDRIWNESLSIQSQQRAARHRRVAAFAHFVCETTSDYDGVDVSPQKGFFLTNCLPDLHKRAILTNDIFGPKGDFLIFHDPKVG